MNPARFSEIKKEYDSFYRDLLARGRLPAKDTKIGFWGASVSDEIFEAFKVLKLSGSQRFIDLGSGDGKVALIASLFCKEAHGVEYDEELHNKSLEIAKKLGISNAKFFNYDFHEHDISDYDLVFISPDKPMRRGTEKKLLDELNGKLIHYGHHFHPAGLRRQRKFVVGGSLVSLYGKKLQ